MARGMLFPAGLTALIVLVLVHRTCSAAEFSHLCAPSSCGKIHNIRYPFRLVSDPENCGDQRYNLSCENNETLVLSLYDGRYYVREINYTNYSIRVVDPGILNDTYIMDHSNFELGDPYKDFYSLRSVVLVNCEKPVNSWMYLDNITNCFKNGVYSNSHSSLSHSKRYTYVLLDPRAEDLEELCQIEQVSQTFWPYDGYYQHDDFWPYDGYYQHDDFRNMSCTDIHSKLLRGFELLWYLVYCGSCRSYIDCYVSKANNVSCFSNDKGFYPPKLFRKCIDVLGGFFNRLITSKTRQKFEIPYIQYGDYYSKKDFFRSLWMNMLYFSGPYLTAKIVLGTPCVIAFLINIWRRRHLSMYDDVEEFLQSHNNLMPIRYSYSEIRKMTKSFKNKLGEGGFGTVFKGTLRSGRFVAIKMLGKSKTNGQDFINEVATIGRIHHVNVVQLIGFCVEGSKRALVYEFMPNGSLNKYIFLQEVSNLLSYDKMYDIALGVARGIEYLHQGCDMQILHFDIKPHNILLDEKFIPKVSDFGLAKLYPVDDSIVSLTAARGTLGYMAPELFYKNIGGVSYKADVYSFGMLLMEMAVRRKNLNAFAEHSSQIYFPTWAYDQLNDGNDIEMEDTTEEGRKIGKKMIIVALWCIQMKPSDRPSMKKVVQMLEGKVECLQMPSKPFMSSLERIITGGEENSNQSNESTQSSQV